MTRNESSRCKMTLAMALLAGSVLCAAPAGAPAQAQAVDRLVIAVDPPAGDTNLFWASSGDQTLFLALSPLVGNDPVTGAYNNDGVAESWEANEDFTEWTFHLYEDVPWTDGWGELTAEDVALSYELNTGEDSQHSGISQLRGATTEVIDDHTIRFVFEEPRQGFLFSLASRGSLLIYSKAQYDAEGLEGLQRQPAGTERFRLVERKVGEGILFERVDDHWSGLDATFPEIEFRWVAEPATKLAMLLAGEAHIADLPPELHEDATGGGLEIVAALNPSNQVTAMFNGLYRQTGDPAHNPDLPWTDIRVREAMNRALDRDTMIDILYGGRAEYLIRYGMKEGHEGYVPELAERFEADHGYDPERAKELLAEAGYPDAFAQPVVPIVASVLAGNPEFGTMAELLQVYFEEIGMQTEIREMDWASLRALGRAREAYVINPIRNSPIRPSEVHLINSYTSGGSPFDGFEDDQIQGLIDKLTTTFDAEERDKIAAEAFTYLYEQYADMPIASIRAEVIINPEFVADWPFPGVTTTGVSHWHLIEPAAN
jgi:peptide/nickel transport system substrate-binding protein